MSLELRFCTIISNDGITIFHRTFVEDDLDEYLFSGFSSAMIAFSNELGDSLSLIKMEKQTIFYHEANEEGFLIMSFTKGYNIEKVQQKIKELYERDSLDLLLAGSKLGIVQNENEKFERDLFEIFDIHSGSTDQFEDTELQNETDYAPPETDVDVPKANRQVKSLEEQLREEADNLEKFLTDEKSEQDKDDSDEMVDALESLEF